MTTIPVEVSDDAHRGLTTHIRKWSGLPGATLDLGQPVGSPFASYLRAGNDGKGRFIANPETLVLNPNRVYLTLTPFRLRQEAVLTGALLHEASHARHTRWTPTTADERKAMLHGLDHGGISVSRQTLEFAKLLEEPRIEGLMAVEADTVGAFNLGWTMRASAAHLVPTTDLDTTNPGQRLMDLITSWVLRAGRQLSLQHHLGMDNYALPTWVGDFDKLLHSELTTHLNGNAVQANIVKRAMKAMACAGTEADTGTWMVDEAREILTILFPETTGDEADAPMPGNPMHSDEDEDDESSTESMPGEGDPDQGEEGPQDHSEDGDQPGEGAQGDGGSDESAEQGSGGGESPSGGGEPGEGQAASPSSSAGEGEGASGGEAGASEQAQATAAMLASIEAEADSTTTDEADANAASAPPPEPTTISGAGTGEGNGKSGWRDPTPDERGVEHGASRFLRNLINPSEVSRTALSESPSSSVDGQALAIWKAGGQRTEPVFFKRTRRTVTPAPPVKIAVLVDISQSMTVLQKPSALLSWALASAAVDLRNFAGRGVQVESTLIHWGTSAHVIQANGDPLPGIREVGCFDGTSAMGKALALVDEQIPGFFDPASTAENRLLVQFTDWDLAYTDHTATDFISRGLAAGVNMLTVVPASYSTRRSNYDKMIRAAKVQRGRTSMLEYNPRRFVGPADVWDAARALLS